MPIYEDRNINNLPEISDVTGAKMVGVSGGNAGSVGAGNFSKVLETDIIGKVDIVSRNFIGANLTKKTEVLKIDKRIRYIRIIPGLNPWPTDTIGGSNPSILWFYGIRANGTKKTFVDYNVNSIIPNEIVLDLGESFVGIEVNFRANSGSEVSFDFLNGDLQNSYDDVKSLQNSFDGNFSDLRIVNRVDCKFVGSNLTAKTKFLNVDGLKSVYIITSPNPWPTDTIGGSNPTILEIDGIRKDGTSKVLKDYFISSTVPEKINLNFSENYEKLKIFFRANSGSEVVVSVINNFDYMTEPLYEKIDTLGIVQHLKFSLVGGGYSAKTKYIDVLGTKRLKVYTTPNPWPTNTIGGSNPSILWILGVREDSSEKSLVDYSISSIIPEVVELNLEEEFKQIKFFFRANENEEVNFVVESCEAKSEDLVISDEDELNAYNNSRRRGIRNPQIMIVADPHASSTSFEKTIKVSKQLSTLVDFIAVTGDICADHPTDNTYQNYKNFVSKSSLPILPVVGNHDVGSSYFIGSYAPISKVVENVMKPCVDKGFVNSNANGYYYKDFDSRKLRFIALNCYEFIGVYDGESKWNRIPYESGLPIIALGTAYASGTKVNIDGWTNYSYQCTEDLTTPSSNPSSVNHNIPCWASGGRPDSARYYHDQMQWLANTLLSTPSGYSVVIALHTIFSRNVDVYENSKFSMKGNFNHNWVLSEGVVNAGTDIISDIVDAFVNGSNINESVSIDGIETYNVACDFTQKNTNVSFCCFIGGHYHKDLVFRHQTRTYQYQVSPSACISWVDDSDLVIRYYNKKLYNNYTLLSVDETNFNLIKVGNKLTDDGYFRDCERFCKV